MKNASFPFFAKKFHNTVVIGHFVKIVNCVCKKHNVSFHYWLVVAYQGTSNEVFYEVYLCRPGRCYNPNKVKFLETTDYKKAEALLKTLAITLDIDTVYWASHLAEKIDGYEE